jgi:hypothetical protein
LRRALGVADDEVLHRLRENPAVIGKVGVRVTRVATDGGRKFTTLLGPVWEAIQRPGDWVFDMPVMAQDQLIDAARSLSGSLN